MQIPKLNIPNKYIKISTWIIGVFLIFSVVAGVYAYSKREALLKTAISKAVTKAKNDFNLNVEIQKASFSGLSTVKLNNVTVIPTDRDTLSHINELKVGVKIWPLVFGNIKLSEIKLNEGFVQVVFKDSLSNIDFILKRKKTDSVESKGTLNLADIANNLLNQVLYKIPDELDVKNFSFKLIKNDSTQLTFNSTANINNGALTSTILVNNKESVWHVDGIVKPNKKYLNFKAYADGKKLELPYLNGKISFDTLQTELKSANYRGSDFKISGAWSVKNMLINQERFANNDIIIENAKLDADVVVGPNFLELDSSSTAYLKNASVHPYIKYTLKPNKIYELKLKAAEQNAQDILDAFPTGLFESLDGLKVNGKVKYDLDFYLDSQNPDSCIFNSTLTPSNFKILEWGAVDLRKINNDFIYTPYEYGKPMRDIHISRNNPNFTELESISPNFINAVLTAEDPSFYRHNGFVEESIRKSIAVNFKEKKFKRGGSTISMQLVKNVYLNRNKTLARKAEEILIVWLIENNHLVSKKRMLEVYFNVMELGRNVYGIGEAARYYFGKSPSELNIGEGLFLANIVPRPKASMYKFEGSGGLKPYMLKYFNFMGNIMARRGLTPADSSGYGFYNVYLREGLRQYLIQDTTKVDTTSFDDEDDLDLAPVEMQDKNKNLFDRLFGGSKKDTVSKQSNPAPDTVKSRKQLRIERREQKQLEKEKTN